MRRLGVSVVALVGILGNWSAQRAWALGLETKGNEPLSERNYLQWPGIMPLVNDKVRVYANWFNGNERLFYKGTTKDLNAALAHFAKIEVKNHIVVLKPAPGVVRSFDRTEIPYNWDLHLMGGLARRVATDDPEDLERQRDPVLTVYVGGDIELDKIEAPKGVTLRSAPGDTKDEKQRATQKRIAEFVAARKAAKE